MKGLNPRWQWHGELHVGHEGQRGLRTKRRRSYLHMQDWAAVIENHVASLNTDRLAEDPHTQTHSWHCAHEPAAILSLTTGTQMQITVQIKRRAILIEQLCWKYKVMIFFLLSLSIKTSCMILSLFVVSWSFRRAKVRDSVQWIDLKLWFSYSFA